MDRGPRKVDFWGGHHLFMFCRAAAAIMPPSSSRVRTYGYSSRVPASRSRVSRGSRPKASSHRYRLASKSLSKVSQKGKKKKQILAVRRNLCKGNDDIVSAAFLCILKGLSYLFMLSLWVMIHLLYKDEQADFDNLIIQWTFTKKDQFLCTT